jgi:hypothetical protein
MSEFDSDDTIFKGLQALFVSSFPKKCSTCGKTYQNIEEFWKETDSIRNLSGLKEGYDDDDKTVVELFRHCVCGSTLMDVCLDRRDLSETGLDRRSKFDNLLGLMALAGIDEQTARKELLLFLSGQKSELLEKLQLADIKAMRLKSHHKKDE